MQLRVSKSHSRRLLYSSTHRERLYQEEAYLVTILLNGRAVGGGSTALTRALVNVSVKYWTFSMLQAEIISVAWSAPSVPDFLFGRAERELYSSKGV
jgi:hypothetical protein